MAKILQKIVLMIDQFVNELIKEAIGELDDLKQAYRFPCCEKHRKIIGSLIEQVETLINKGKVKKYH
jgi:hypothetical protein